MEGSDHSRELRQRPTARKIMRALCNAGKPMRRFDIAGRIGASYHHVERYLNELQDARLIEVVGDDWGLGPDGRKKRHGRVQAVGTVEDLMKSPKIVTHDGFGPLMGHDRSNDRELGSRKVDVRRDRLSRDVKAFLDSGGKVERLPDYEDAPKSSAGVHGRANGWM